MTPLAALPLVASAMAVLLGCETLAERTTAAPAERVDHETADWNEDAIAWRPFEAGLAEARQKNVPIFLVFYTTWCPHCHNTSWLFHDPRIVEKSSSFIMIRVDRDEAPAVSERYDIDGQYIPRVFVAKPTGEVVRTITPHERDEYRHFANEYDPAEVLAMMERGSELETP